ncbi:MAG: phosphonate C-P lyase system protein PhnH [Rhodobacteraceae bacterium HLUCCA08]|nr:MAG: phosphonate C-P lyase system protein PhnH [Rhodobacteraceae bacterium HLUCCA08]
MLTTPVADAAETRANATYEAILWAFSRPGMPRRMPHSGEAGVIEALIDRECAVHAADPLLIPPLLQAGARLVEPEAADHVFAGRLTDPALLGRCRAGSALYPDDGATLVIRARFGQGAGVRFVGPGVDGGVKLRIGDLPEGFWRDRARCVRYPAGVDILFLDGEGLIGLPRSTTVEVM